MRGPRSPKRVARKLLGPRTMSEVEVLHELMSDEPRGAVMVDVGAHWGESLLPFAVDGWEVHAFEPDPVNRAHLHHTCRELPNVAVIPKAVSARQGEVTLYRSAESSGISTLSAFSPSHHAMGAVEVTTLRTYCDEVGLQRVTFLKIDAEGFDRFVLEGQPWDRLRPRAILCEFEDNKTVQLGYTWKDLAEDVVGYGYRVLVSEWRPVRAYGADHQWRRFAPYPTRLVDEAATGNLLAVAEEEFDRLSTIARRSAVRLSVRRQIDKLRRSRA